MTKPRHRQPWKVQGHEIVDADSMLVANLRDALIDTSDAALIVRDVNSHSRLVNSLKALLIGITNGLTRQELSAVITTAAALLAELEGGAK